MESALFDCMHSGELLLGMSAVLVLLIIAGSVTALLVAQFGRSSAAHRALNNDDKTKTTL